MEFNSDDANMPLHTQPSRTRQP